MTSPSNVEESAIRQLIAQAQAHQFDLVELMKLHDDDVVITNMAGRRVFGKQAFSEAMGRALSSGLQHVHTTVEVDRVRFLSPDCAIVWCTKTVHDHRPTPEKNALPGSMGLMTCVVVKRGGHWLIASAQTTPVAP